MIKIFTLWIVVKNYTTRVASMHNLISKRNNLYSESVID